MRTWLEETRQLDLSDPKLRITAQKLTQSRQCLHARAAAIHDYVRRMPFAAGPRGSRLCASTVLRKGMGDGQAKGLLFTALCRAAGLPARLLFAQVNAHALAGMRDGGPDSVIHAVGQVRVGERWLSTDGYVIDPVMFALAKETLQRDGMDSGWGIVRDAQGRWDGRCTSIQQFRPGDVIATLGVFSDLDEFRKAGVGAAAGWLAGLQDRVDAFLLNRRIARLRGQRTLVH